MMYFLLILFVAVGPVQSLNGEHISRCISSQSDRFTFGAFTFFWWSVIYLSRKDPVLRQATIQLHETSSHEITACEIRPDLINKYHRKNPLYPPCEIKNHIIFFR